MKLLDKKLEDFKPISLDDQAQDDNYFDLLFTILKKINKSGLKSSNTLSILKDEILMEVKKTSTTIDDIRDERIKVLHDNEKLEKGILEYNDIVENLHNAAQSMKSLELAEMTTIALKALTQINAKLGVTKIPSDSHTIPDSEYHIICNTKDTENESFNDQISKVVENGYRRGEKVLRRASVTVFKYKDSGNE